MGAERTLTVKVLGDAKGGQKALQDTEKSAGGLHSTMRKAGVAIAASFVAAGAATAVFAKKSIDQFKSVGSETNQLIRLTGGSAESMSRLRYAAQQTGTSIDSLGNGMKKLSKEVEAGGEHLKEAGIRFKDAHGKALPLDGVLLNVADKFAKMPNGIEKNALAMQLFGKQGTDLIPILNKGKAGLEALEKQADKYGLTLTQKNLDAIKKNAQAHKDFHAALAGLEVQVGAALMPVLASMAQLMSTTLVPAIVRATDFVRGNFGPFFSAAFDDARGGVERLVNFVRDVAIPWIVDVWAKHGPTFQAVWKDFKQAFDDVKTKIETSLVPKLQDAWHWLAEKVLPAAQDVASALQDQLGPAVSDLSAGSVLGAVVALGSLAEALTIIAGLAPVAAVLSALSFSIGSVAIPGVVVAGVIAALVAGVIYAYTHFETFRDVVGAVADFFVTNVVPAIGVFVDWIVRKFGEVRAFTAEIWPQVQEAVTHAVNVIRDVLAVVLVLIVGIWRIWGDDIQRIALGVFALVRAGIHFEINLIADIVRLVLGIINGDWGKAWGAIKDIQRDVLDYLVNATRAGLNILFGVVDGMLKGIRSLFSGGLDILVAGVAALGGRISGAAASFRNVLVDAGRAVIEGLIRGIDLSLGGLGSKLAAVGNFIKAHKGPPEKDAKLLFGAGQLIIGGLIGGIESQLPSLRGALSGVSATVAAPSATLAGAAGPASTSYVTRNNYLSVYTQQSEASLTEQFARMDRMALPL